MQKITSLSAEVFGRQSKEFRKIGGQAFWPRLYTNEVGVGDNEGQNLTYTGLHFF